VPEHIGNAGTRAKAWAERTVLFLSPQAERGKQLEKFAERRRPFFDRGQPRDVNTHTEGLGLLAHEPTHVIRQTQPQRLPQIANRDYSPAPAALTRTPSDAVMVLPAPAENTPLTTSPVRSQAQAGASESPGTEGPAEKRAETASRIDVGEVADRVYRLMQRDLILERERATKLGG